jgi:hypothetical protein
MQRFMPISRPFLVIALVCLGCGARADDFRIENRVFAEGNAVPESRSLTLFHEGTVYDFMAEPPEVTIFDKSAGQFILLDMTERQQAQLSTADVKAFVEKLRRVAGQQKDPVTRFLADPKFAETYDPANDELSLASPSVTYRIVAAMPKNESIVGQYRDFSDNYTRLNAMLNPGSRPPFARLQANEALARHEAVAREVSLTIVSVKNGAPEKSILRSTHDLATSLSASDLEQIEKAGEARANFKVVPLSKYEKRRK